MKTNSSPGPRKTTRCPETIEVNGVLAPPAPSSIAESGIDADVLVGLALRLAYAVPHLTTEEAVQTLGLPLPIVDELFNRLTADMLIQVSGQAGPFSYRYAISEQGREQARRLLEISGYIGPAPVALEAYTAMIEHQLERLPAPSPQQVADSISDLVLPEEVIEIVGLALSSGRSLFLYGPPGNGKTSVGNMAYNALAGQIWIPQCIGIDNRVVRLFDPQVHRRVTMDLSHDQARRIDRRWVLIDRPFVVVGGELTTGDLDLAYDAGRGYYEAPLHLKANGGLFLLDDFGTQREEPRRLLNRWIIPLEHQVDYLTMQTGEKLQIPFRQMLIVSTNLELGTVMAPALLRRMGYRLQLNNPSPQDYAEVFRRYAARYDLKVPPDLIDWLLQRYRAEDRVLRSCEPRDLIERARDICRFRGQPAELNQKTLTLAWKGYFGNEWSQQP